MGNTPQQQGSKQLPLVMLHGFGCGASIWCLNMESLSEHRKIYAFDVLALLAPLVPFSVGVKRWPSSS